MTPTGATKGGSGEYAIRGRHWPLGAYKASLFLPDLTEIVADYRGSLFLSDLTETVASYKASLFPSDLTEIVADYRGSLFL